MALLGYASRMKKNLSLTLLAGAVLSAPVQTILAANNQAESIPLWDTVMLVIVFLTLSSSAALTVAAWRQWQRGWRLVAALPLVILVLWSGWIVGARSIDPVAHALWSFELFGWALLNLLYMVTALTAKRAFEKADNGA
jgi:hypothetical protein